MRIREVKSRSDWKGFVQFPHELYRDNDHWVPELRKAEIEKLDPSTSVFAERFQWKAWWAEKDGKIVGRILCNIDQQEPDLAKFGWWETIDDQNVTKALFDKATKWALSKGAKELKGPLGFTNLDKTGLMTDGFDHYPTIAEHYHFPYYQEHLRQYGFQTANEYVSYTIAAPKIIPDKVIRIADMVKKRYGYSVKMPNSRKEAKQLAMEAFQLMNESHAELEGHTELGMNLIEHYVEEFLPAARVEYACFIYQQESLIGFGVAMPNYSKAFQKTNGKIWPFGWWHILSTKWWHKKADLMIIGVHPEHRNKGVTAIIFKEIMQAFIKSGVDEVESNPELKENKNVQQLWSSYDPKKAKEWKTYVRML